MTTQQRNFRVSKLETSHATALNAVSGTKTLAQVATSLGIPQNMTQQKLSLLVDEGFIVALKNSKGTPTGAYTAA